MSSRQVSLLFADVQGFTKLRGAEVEVFVTTVMGKLAAALSSYRCLVKNTWGDALFAVFETADVAAGCALALRDAIRDTRWQDRGIYSDLRIRIALHNAHATITRDPVTKNANAYGQHVNKAARLEPVVAPNEVFATEEFKRALDAFGSGPYMWDEVGNVPLAKDWGESTVFRLRRPSEEKWSTSKSAQLVKGASSLDQLMPHARKLLARKDHAATLDNLLKYVDSFLLEPGIVRRNWLIQVNYDTRRLQREGVIVENIQWSFELLNITGAPLVCDLRQIGSPTLEGQTGLISWHQIDERGNEKRLPLPPATEIKEEVFQVRRNDFTLDPDTINKFELRVEQTWPVNQERPIFHNAWAPRQPSFINRLELEGPFKTVGVLYGDGELTPTHHKENRYVYNIPSPMLREQLVEILIEFEP